METLDINSSSATNDSTELKVNADMRNLYEILGVDNTASKSDIVSAYENLAVKYQSEQGSTEILSRINKAYFILSDNHLRSKYDLTGEEDIQLPKVENDENHEGMDVSNLGGIGRVFGGIGRLLGVPVPTTISHEILDVAVDICRGDSMKGGALPNDPRLSDLYWGWGIESRVDRQAGMFFRLMVDDYHVENGFMLYCRSPSKGKFKLIIFDADGNLLHQDDSIKARDRTVTEAALYFTNFDTYRLGEILPGPLREHDAPQLFYKLDHFTPSKYSIVPGKYLVCVYGDNFMGKTSFAILALPAKNDCPEVQEIVEVDEKIKTTKASLDEFRTQYIKSKEEYESNVKRLSEEAKALEDLLDRREDAYRGLLSASARANAPKDLPIPSPASRSSTAISSSSSSSSSNTASGGVLPGIVPAARDTIVEAGAAASAAGGWLASRFATSFGQLSKIVTNAATARNTPTSTSTNLPSGLEAESSDFKEVVEVEDPSLSSPDAIRESESTPLTQPEKEEEVEEVPDNRKEENKKLVNEEEEAHV